jgi:predicted MPP superfamily phosphohydrolase
MSLVVRHESVSWGEGTGRLRLAHLSDLHVKWSGRRLDEVAASLDEQHPDVVICTGDWFDTPRGAELCHAFLQRIAIERPVCWISGNHDHWFGPGVLAPFYAVPGVFCVDDAPWTMETANGLQCEFISWSGHLATAPRPGVRRVVLIHNPEDITVKNLPGCDLVLAGHLHGGQFIFHRTRNGFHFPGNLLYRWCCDRREVSDTSVIVSRGLGDTLPLRFRCAHEVVMITLDYVNTTAIDATHRGVNGAGNEGR